LSPSYRSGPVTEILEQRSGLQRVLVDLGRDRPERAYALTQLTGPVAIGDRLVVNTTAVDLDLGTGGWHVVHWNLARDEWAETGPGHIMKLRYTSLQVDSGTAEEDHPDLATDLAGTPVVVGTVHSQLPCVVATARHARPDLRIAYVMTDGAALPLALSDLVAHLSGHDLIVGTVTAGHAFGGDAEAVGVPAALAIARHLLNADLIVVTMGPGVVGTDTRLGTTALEAAACLDQAAALGGVPILALRASSGDPRPRHRGVSHHSGTVLDLVRSPIHVAAHPELDAPSRHSVHTVPDVDVPTLLAAHDLHVTTMGRAPDEDADFFATAGRAGTLAISLLADDATSLLADDATSLLADDPASLLADDPASLLADDPASVFGDD
jgi:hypothetical protein